MEASVVAHLRTHLEAIWQWVGARMASKARRDVLVPEELAQQQDLSV